MTNNIVNFPVAKEKNKPLQTVDSKTYSLRELADKVDNGEIRDIFLAWTMANGDIHYAHGVEAKSSTKWADDQLRLLGLLRIAERGFIDAFTLDTPTDAA